MKRIADLLVVATAVMSILAGCSSVAARLTTGNGPTNCVETTYLLERDTGNTIDAATLDAERTIVTNRLSSWPVADPSVEQEPPDILVVRLPRPGLTRDIQALIAKRGLITAVPIPPEFAATVVVGQPLPQGMNVTPIFTSEDIASAHQEPDELGTPTVDVLLKPDAATAFDDFAKGAYHGTNTPKFALLVDDTVILALTPMSDHFGGQVQIAGQLNGDAATRLVAYAAYGPLPASLDVVSSLIRSCSSAG